MKFAISGNFPFRSIKMRRFPLHFSPERLNFFAESNGHRSNQEKQKKSHWWNCQRPKNFPAFINPFARSQKSQCFCMEMWKHIRWIPMQKFQICLKKYKNMKIHRRRRKISSRSWDNRISKTFSCSFQNDFYNTVNNRKIFFIYLSEQKTSSNNNNKVKKIFGKFR